MNKIAQVNIIPLLIILVIGGLIISPSSSIFEKKVQYVGEKFKNDFKMSDGLYDEYAYNFNNEKLTCGDWECYPTVGKIEYKQCEKYETCYCSFDTPEKWLQSRGCGEVQLDTTVNENPTASIIVSEDYGAIPVNKPITIGLDCLNEDPILQQNYWKNSCYLDIVMLKDATSNPQVLSEDIVNPAYSTGLKFQYSSAVGCFATDTFIFKKPNERGIIRITPSEGCKEQTSTTNGEVKDRYISFYTVETDQVLICPNDEYFCKNNNKYLLEYNYKNSCSTTEKLIETCSDTCIDGECVETQNTIDNPVVDIISNELTEEQNFYCEIPQNTPNDIMPWLIQGCSNFNYKNEPLNNDNDPCSASKYSYDATSNVLQPFAKTYTGPVYNNPLEGTCADTETCIEGTCTPIEANLGESCEYKGERNGGCAVDLACYSNNICGQKINNDVCEFSSENVVMNKISGYKNLLKLNNDNSVEIIDCTQLDSVCKYNECIRTQAKLSITIIFEGIRIIGQFIKAVIISLSGG